MKITKVYTRTGDKGETSLVGGVRIKKSHVRLEAYGTVDELSAHLGLLASQLKDDNERDLVVRVQNNLFNVCTHLATDQSQTPLYPSARAPGLRPARWSSHGLSSPCLPHGVPSCRTAYSRTCRGCRGRSRDEPICQPTERLSVCLGKKNKF